MRRQPGDRVTALNLPAIDGSEFALETLQGKPYLLSFFRFASCPFCNLRLHELVTRYGELDNGFSVVAIFDSPLENLKRHAEGHRPPFPVLADEHNVYYRAFGIEHSWARLIKGMVIRFPTLLKAIFVHGYVPLTFQGRLETMPADFLVDREGVIRVAYYGHDEGDRLPFEQIKAFALTQRKRRTRHVGTSAHDHDQRPSREGLEGIGRPGGGPTL